MRPPSEGDVPGTGLAIAVASLLVSVPEAPPPMALIVAFAPTNLAEGLSSLGPRPRLRPQRGYSTLVEFVGPDVDACTCPREQRIHHRYPCAISTMS